MMLIAIFWATRNSIVLHYYSIHIVLREPAGPGELRSKFQILFLQELLV